MRAWQCDRCGRLYSQSSKDTNKILIADSYTVTGCIKGIQDLCDKCQKEFEVWWTKKKKKEKEAGDEQATSKETQKESTI